MSLATLLLLSFESGVCRAQAPAQPSLPPSAAPQSSLGPCRQRWLPRLNRCPCGGRRFLRLGTGLPPRRQCCPRPSIPRGARAAKISGAVAAAGVICALPAGGRGCSEPQARAARADRPSLPDQPRHRLAALRRPAADRGRRAGRASGWPRRSSRGPRSSGFPAQHRRRLHPARRRRPGLQQGHHDRAERELLLRRCRPDGRSSP